MLSSPVKLSSCGRQTRNPAPNNHNPTNPKRDAGPVPRHRTATDGPIHANSAANGSTVAHIMINIK